MQIKVLGIALIAVLVIVGISACGSKKGIEKVAKGEVKYGLKKGACFGRCPMYDLKIYEGGNAVLKGERFMSKIGTYELKLNKAEYKALEEKFASVDFMAFPDTFPSMIPDLPAVWITHHNGDMSKTVYGKEDRPESLMQLQFALEEVLDHKDWVLVKEYDPTEQSNKVSLIKDEFVVQPHPGKMLPAWFERYKAYKLRLVKKLTPDLEYYLLTYDMNRIAPEEMLQKLKDDPAIRLVEFNKTTDKREQKDSRR